MGRLQIERGFGNIAGLDAALVNPAPVGRSEAESFDRHLVDARHQQASSSQQSARQESRVKSADEDSNRPEALAEPTPADEPVREEAKTADAADTSHDRSPQASTDATASESPTEENPGEQSNGAAMSAEAAAMVAHGQQSVTNASGEPAATAPVAKENAKPGSKTASRADSNLVPPSAATLAANQSQPSDGDVAAAAEGSDTAISAEEPATKARTAARSELDAEPNVSTGPLELNPQGAEGDGSAHDQPVAIAPADVPPPATVASDAAQPATSVAGVTAASGNEKKGIAVRDRGHAAPANGPALSAAALPGETFLDPLANPALESVLAEMGLDPQGDSGQPKSQEGQPSTESPAAAAGVGPAPHKNVVESLTGASSRGSHGMEISEPDRARFVQRVSRAFQSFGEDGGQLRLRLSPAELGSIRLEVTVQKGMLIAHVEAETPQARNLLLENLPALRERLQEHNIKIERFDVDVMNQQSSGGSSQESARRQQQDHFERQTNQRTRSSPESVVVAPARLPPRPVTNDGKLNVVV